ncbi:MAG: MBL fold metallo-hydrolase [Actinomycetota bacterium]|nr:MBL fold metallo-hydrolase [Actinomycetota bacterium]
MNPKPATEATRAVLARAAGLLERDDRRDFDDAARGLIAPLPDGGSILDDAGGQVWDVGQYQWVNEGECPDSVHPSLRRQTQLLTLHGLFEVCEGIYQVRSADLANMTIIEGDTGIVLVDPLTAPPTARAALDLYVEHRGERPVHAVIHTHSHIDHYGGVRGVTNDDDVAAGRTRIIAPVGFTEAALSENVLAGNAMGRRASYMYGPLLPKGPTGTVSPALGLGIPLATTSFMVPTDEITDDVETMTIDGVEFVFMLAPDTEAPAEMLFHLPGFSALCTAEDATHTLHNLYTLRGARTRDAKAWAYYINKAIELFADRSELCFAQHHWPTWGRERVVDFLESQRDAYQYLHDQTLRLANHGENMVEIAEQLDFPSSLGERWCNRGYYGSVNHNAKAVYNLYLGWFDGNPSTLHPLPPVESSVKYVDYMGGAAAVIERARADFEAGEYRWVAQVLNHVVFADAGNSEARELLADTLEQLGYQTENGVWRNFYLTGAQELRIGTLDLGARGFVSPDTFAAMPVAMLVDYLAVRLNGPAADGEHLVINLVLTEPDEERVLEVRRSVLQSATGSRRADAAVTLQMTTAAFKVLVTSGDIDEQLAAGDVTVEGDVEVWRRFRGLLDDFSFWFPIIEP